MSASSMPMLIDRACIESLGKSNLVGLTDAVLNDRPAGVLPNRCKGAICGSCLLDRQSAKRNSIFTIPYLTSSLRQLQSEFQYLLIVFSR